MIQLPLFRIDAEGTGTEINYRIHYIDPLRYEGNANVCLHYCGSRDSDDPLHARGFKLRRKLIERGVMEGDYAFKIRAFYPNGGQTYGKPYHVMRQGMGSLMLERIIKDALELDTKLVYLDTIEPEMREFVNKKGFTRVGETNTYFKLI